MEEKKVELVGPEVAVEERQARNQQQSLAQAGIAKEFGQQSFVLLEDGKAMRCPAGKRMERKTIEKRYTAYQASRKDCEGCMNRAQCCPKSGARMVKIKKENRAVKAYQERGFYHATVDTETTVAASTSTTTFNINPGQEYKLAAVTFTGNAMESDKALANVVTTTPHSGFFAFLGSMFGRRHGVTQTQLSADRDALESHYRLNGFSEATVATHYTFTSVTAGNDCLGVALAGPSFVITATPFGSQASDGTLCLDSRNNKTPGTKWEST